MGTNVKNGDNVDNVCVIMSAYNGEKYIREQLDSIFGQFGVEVTVYVRDDGSKDSTISIIEGYPEYNRSLFLLKGSNIGCTSSFYELIRYVNLNCSKYDFYAYADQDDKWMPEKLQMAIKQLKKYDEELPNLYYSNLCVVNDKLEYLYDRFSKGYVTNTKSQVLAEVCSYGCTCVFNYSMLGEMAKFADDKSVYHDNWILWVAVFLGNCFYDENGYILYRQHQNNASGQIRKKGKFLCNQLYKLKDLRKMRPNYEIRAKKFLEIYSKDDRLLAEDKKMIEVVAYYKDNVKYKIRLLFTNEINSGHLLKEISRRIRIILKVL